MTEEKYIYKMRVENCIGTIIDVHKIISQKPEYKTLISQFEELRDLLKRLDMSLVQEEDVQRIEQATNSLLNELKDIFQEAGLGPVYNKPMN
ncbi:MAG: hypothetical protein DRG27_05415 [Deltaproteobacteria bacterium]|nr:MAG: hypothetical protein DRG27_05415 [Deltaproteobacteria bacterium]